MNAIALGTGEVTRAAFGQLAPLFCYPEPSFAAAPAPPAGSDLIAPFLAAFARETATLTLSERQALYTATFDLAPVCSPYLGVHLFDEEGPQRPRLMVGLKQTYAKQGHLAVELPDHIAEVLAFAERFAEEEWAELVQLVLEPAAAKMRALLEEASNPYRHLLGAVSALCEGGSR